jgi:hypothetical protein
MLKKQTLTVFDCSTIPVDRDVDKGVNTGGDDSRTTGNGKMHKK